MIFDTNEVQCPSPSLRATGWLMGFRLGHMVYNSLLYFLWPLGYLPPEATASLCLMVDLTPIFEKKAWDLSAIGLL